MQKNTYLCDVRGEEKSVGRQTKTKRKPNRTRLECQQAAAMARGPRHFCTHEDSQMGPAVTSSAARREARGGSARRQRGTTLTRCRAGGRRCRGTARWSCALFRPMAPARSLTLPSDETLRSPRALHQHHIRLIQLKLLGRKLELVGVVCFVVRDSSWNCVLGRRDFLVWFGVCLMRCD